MSLIPIDKQADELISRKARETGKTKADILRQIIERAAPGGDGESDFAPQEMAKAMSLMPEGRPGSLADRMKDMVETMFMYKMMDKMSAPPAEAKSGFGGDLGQIIMWKEISKPSMYEMMYMEKLGKGEAPPEWLKQMAEDQKETRELLRQVIGGKQEEDRMKTYVEPIVKKMTETTDALAQNQTAILEYINKGQQAPPDSITARLGMALQSRLEEEVMDAIDKGLFKRQEVVNPQTGQFNWQEALNRMIGTAEKFIEKMPTRAPAPAMVRTLDGRMVNPATGEVVGGAAPLLKTGPPSDAGGADVVAMQGQTQQAEQQTDEAIRKKKASELTDQFMGQGAEESEQPVANEPSGEEQY